MGDSKRTIYTATLQEREAVCAEAYDLRVKAALRFCAGVPIPEGGPTLVEVLEALREAKVNLDCTFRDAGRRRDAASKRAEVILDHFQQGKSNG